MVEELRSGHAIQAICEALEISRSSYYAYCQGQSYQPSDFKRELLKEVKEIFEDHKRRYGSRRVHEVLKDRGYTIGIRRVKSLMKEQGLIAIQPKSYVPQTTQSNPSLYRNDNMLLESMHLPEGPNEVIVGDITYLPCNQDGYNVWLYLAVWMDLYSRRICGWCVDEFMDESIVIRALEQVIRNRQPQSGLIVHSDGGGQYASNNFRKILKDQGYRQSMTRRDNHYDNAFAESLFSRFKAELLEDDFFTGLDDARLKIFEYIEAYYNTIRKHSSIGYFSPDQFEQLYWRNYSNSF